MTADGIKWRGLGGRRAWWILLQVRYPRYGCQQSLSSSRDNSGEPVNQSRASMTVDSGRFREDGPRARIVTGERTSTHWSCHRIRKYSLGIVTGICLIAGFQFHMSHHSRFGGSRTTGTWRRLRRSPLLPADGVCYREKFSITPSPARTVQPGVLKLRVRKPQIKGTALFLLHVIPVVANLQALSYFFFF